MKARKCGSGIIVLEIGDNEILFSLGRPVAAYLPTRGREGVEESIIVTSYHWGVQTQYHISAWIREWDESQLEPPPFKYVPQEVLDGLVEIPERAGVH